MITTEFLRLTILLQSIKMNFQLISYSLMLTCLLKVCPTLCLVVGEEDFPT